jgi:myo-inositol-1(or 4)-monophosphatase
MQGRDQASIDRYLTVFAREAGHMAIEMAKNLESVATKDGQMPNASNVVTEADTTIGRFAEEFFPAVIPGAIVIQEETVDDFDPAMIDADSIVFIVDPIDGTLFYAKHSFAWTVSVGCFIGFQPVSGCIYAPHIDEMYYTEGGHSYLNGKRIHAYCPDSEDSLSGSIMLRHIKAYHSIDAFPGYTCSYGSVALHLAMVASGFACCCVTSKHRLYDVAGSASLLKNAGAELTYVDGTTPSWKDLILAPACRAPKHFFACPAGRTEQLCSFAVLQA